MRKPICALTCPQVSPEQLSPRHQSLLGFIAQPCALAYRLLPHVRLAQRQIERR